MYDAEYYKLGNSNVSFFVGTDIYIDSFCMTIFIFYLCIGSAKT